jgi:hypothetical protein
VQARDGHRPSLRRGAQGPQWESRPFLN